MTSGYVFTGQYSDFRKRRHGSPATDLLSSQFVVCSQNHDQVGNRMLGERSSALLDFESLKLCAGMVLLSRNLPLLFMGEEYGETAPFLYFTDHSDPGLGEAVRKGRKQEFAAFHAQGEAPDPQAESTFLASKLDHSLAVQSSHRVLLDFHTELIRLRKELAALQRSTTFEVTVCGPHDCLSVHYEYDEGGFLAFFNFNENLSRVTSMTSGKEWRKVLDSAEGKWLGPGSGVPEEIDFEAQTELKLAARSFCLFRRCG
jgi:maltooligosyltrehalose trehalohydrolase